MSGKEINELIEYDEEDEEYSEIGNYLKDNFNLDDFLNFDKTREILEKNCRWQVEKDLDSIITNFYKGEIDFQGVGGEKERGKKCLKKKNF